MPPPRCRIPEAVRAPEATNLEELAEEWVRDIMRRFGLATALLSRYDCAKAVNVIESMPPEQRKSWRAVLMLGRAHFETLDYEEAS